MNGEMLRKRWLLTGTAVLALSSMTLPASAGQRALSDFTSQQGAWCAVFNDEGIDCAASHYGPCADDEIRFTFPQFWVDPKTGFTAQIDTLGQGGDFGTTVDGSVSESARPDGFAEVKVVLHSGNAPMRARDVDRKPLFGYGRPEPTLGDAVAQIKFTNTAPGAPLPDINQLFSCAEPGQALETFSIRARASGPLREAFGLPEGSPGRLEVTQTGLLGTAALVDPHSRLAVDAYPAEHVIIRATGN